jgi:Xaa-Pro aminopeptidase
MDATVAAALAARRERYARVLGAAGADVAVLASEAGVAHATGARLYTMALIPERPVVALVSMTETVLVCWEWERDQIRAERPDLALVGFPEWGSDPWHTVAREARRLAGPHGTALLEATVPAPAVSALQARGLRVRVDDELTLLGVRAPKDPDELAHLIAAARTGDEAIAMIAAGTVRGRTERQLADAIAARFRESVRGDVESAGICSGPASNRSNHHLADDVSLEPGPVRLGLKAQVNGYWLVLTRMAWASADGGAADSAFAEDYTAYMAAHEAGWRALRPGVSAGEPYALVRERLAAGGLRLRSPKVGHGTGLSFRELPVLRDGDSTPVEAGTFLAFDFAIHPESARSGAFLHVEDRIVVTGDGPVRVSDAVDTRRPISLRL